jgi:hypothetical protein
MHKAAIMRCDISTSIQGHKPTLHQARPQVIHSWVGTPSALHPPTHPGGYVRRLLLLPGELGDEAPPVAPALVLEQHCKEGVGGIKAHAQSCTLTSAGR